MNCNDILWLAPMLGFTEYHFRNTYSRHFSGIDAAVMPFVTLVEGEMLKLTISKMCGRTTTIVLFDWCRKFSETTARCLLP